MRSCVAHYKTESGNNCTAAEITLFTIYLDNETKFLFTSKGLKFLKKI